MSKLWETVSMGLQRAGHDLATEQQKTTTFPYPFDRWRHWGLMTLNNLHKFTGKQGEKPGCKPRKKGSRVHALNHCATLPLLSPKLYLLCQDHQHGTTSQSGWQLLYCLDDSWEKCRLFWPKGLYTGTPGEGLPKPQASPSGVEVGPRCSRQRWNPETPELHLWENSISECG